MQRSWLVAAAMLAIWPIAMQARDVLPGPIPAQVLRVVDGDTLEVRARIWLGQDVTTLLRLADIDTPEVRGACADENALAAQATSFVRDALGTDDNPPTISLFEVTEDKYGGRVVARVVVADGRDLGAALIAAQLAQPYDGGTRPNWCKEEARR